MQEINKAVLLSEPNQNFDMFTIGIELSDGRKGACFAKSSDKWNAGDKVEVEVAGTMKGGKAKGLPRFKLTKATSGGGYSGGGNKGNYKQGSPKGGDNSTGMMVGNCLKLAVDILARQSNVTEENIVATGKMLISANKALLAYAQGNDAPEHGKPASEQPTQPTQPATQTEEEDDIPF